MIKKISIMLFLLGNMLILKGEAAVLLEKAALNSRYFIVDSTLLSDTGKSERLFVAQHPLVSCYEYHEVQLPNGARGYRRNDVVPSADGKGVELLPEVPVTRLLFGVITVIFLAFIILKGLKHGFKEWQLLMLPLLFRILLSLIVICKWDNIYTNAADEPGYFAVAKDILNGQWRNQWHFTIGNPLLYIPFILMTGAEGFYDLVPYYNWFSLFVYGPGVLALGFLILRKFGVPAKRACGFILLWAVLPFVLFHSENWSNWTFQHFFLHSQLFSRFIRLAFYGFCINSGFNAMSDMPGLLAVLGCFYFALAMPGKKRYAALFGILFGFSCLIRINYIILAPLFAFILYRKFAFDRKEMILAALSGVGTFLLTFGVQLIANHLQFGSPFTFGYILHYPEYAVPDRPAAGFTWHTFSKLRYARFLLQVNLPVFSIGTAALWTMRNRFKRTALVLASVPLILFFSGYSHTFCDGRRFVFPAFAAMLMAVAVADFWKKLRLRDEIELSAALLLMTILGLPYESPWKGFPLMLGDGLFLRFAGVAIPVWLAVLIFRFLRKGKISAAAFTALSAIFYYAPSLILGTAMLLLLPAIVVDLLIPQKVKLKFYKKVLRIVSKKSL